MARLCATCAVPLPVQEKGRPRKFCPACSLERDRARRRKPAGVAPVVSLPDPGDQPDGSVTVATRERLEAACRVDTWEGAAALAIARELDGHQLTGSQRAALTREFRATMTEALRGVKGEPDAVDDLRDRREKRIRGA